MICNPPMPVDEPMLLLPGKGRLPIHQVIVGASLFGWLCGQP